MHYLTLALVTLVFLGIHYFLAKLISPHVASPVIALACCTACIPPLIAYIYFTKTPFIPQNGLYLGLAFLIGLPAAIGILTLYMAIERGPVSIVMPIYGLNATMTAVLGIFILRESLSLEKAFGLILAVAAIILLSR
jgi:transporter family protein